MAFKMLLSLLIGFFACFCAADQPQTLLSQDYSAARPHRVAIIGGGAGGSSTAYHLRKFVDSSPYDLSIEIDLFETESRIGGRTTTVNALDDEQFPVEVGGSIYVDVNHILVNLTKEFGLNAKTKSFSINSESQYDLGVWDGFQFVFKQSSGRSWWQGYWDVTKMLWQYGVSPVRTQRLMKDAVGRFLKFYESPTFPFQTIQEAVSKHGLLDFTSETGSQLVVKAGISDAFARDIIQASTRVNYAQNLQDINGLLTMCCMATDGAMAVEGGNWQIFDEAVKHSRANLMLNTTVGAVIKDPRSQHYYLVLRSKEEGQTRLPDPYDSVVLAAPYQYSGIEFEPELDYLPQSIDYVSLHVTLFTTPHIMNPVFFELSSDEYMSIPSTVLTTKPGGLNSTSAEPHKFFSISTLRIIDQHQHYAQYLYKIFSPAPLTGTFMSELFGFDDAWTNTTVSDPISDIPKEHITWSHEKKWHSYPYEIPRILFEQIRLDGWRGSGKGIWYTSGIESFISTMETSALSGMNVAKLVAQEIEWHHSSEEIAHEEL